MQIKGSDVLDYDKAVATGMQLIETGVDENFGFMVVCGINMGLRVSDLLTIDYSQIKKGEFILTEKKTGKKRKVVANSVVLEALEKMPDTPQKELGGKCFVSNKGGVYSTQHVNRLLKKYFESEDQKISSHSMRKGWGKRYYDMYHKEGGLSDLQLQFNHSKPSVTLAYIGRTQAQLDGMYEKVVGKRTV